MKTPPRRRRPTQFNPASRAGNEPAAASQDGDGMPTALERALMQTREGEVAVSDLIRELTETELLLPSGMPLQADGSGLDPVIFDKDGVPMVACYTQKERIGPVSEIAPHVLQIRGGDLLGRIPPGHGLVINPKHELWFDLSPAGVALAISEMS